MKKSNRGKEIEGWDRAGEREGRSWEEGQKKIRNQNAKTNGKKREGGKRKKAGAVREYKEGAKDKNKDSRGISSTTKRRSGGSRETRRNVRQFGYGNMGQIDKKRMKSREIGKRKRAGSPFAEVYKSKNLGERSRTVTKPKAQNAERERGRKGSSGVEKGVGNPKRAWAGAVTRLGDTSGCIGDTVDLGSRCLFKPNQKSDPFFVQLFSTRG